MKRSVILAVAILLSLCGNGQNTQQASDSIKLVNLNKTLNAATIVGGMAFAFQAIGIGFAAGAVVTEEGIFGPLSVTAIIGSGGNGMEITHAKLVKSIYVQIEKLSFIQEDSTIRARMLSNMRTAGILAKIQFFAPFMAMAAGGLAYLVSGLEQNAFSITLLTLYSVGICTFIPEIMLIKNTRRDLKECQQRLTLGRTGFGFGISYKF